MTPAARLLTLITLAIVSWAGVALITTLAVSR